MEIRFENKYLDDMSVFHIDKVPNELKLRMGKLPIDRWFYDKSEKNDISKLACVCANDGIDYGTLIFYYCFVKTSDVLNSEKKWEFKVLNISSDIPGAIGNWTKDDYKDTELEKIRDFQWELGAGDHIDATEVRRIIRLFNLS